MQTSGNALEMQGGILAEGILGDHLPVELNRVIHNGGKLADDQVNIGHTDSISLPGMPVGDLQDAFGDGKLVHAEYIILC